jgi:hypothetical protein
MASSSSKKPEPRKPDPPPPGGGALFAVRVLAFAALAVPLLLRTRLDRLGARLTPAAPSPAAPVPRQEAEALARAIDRLLLAGRPLVRSGCLTRGITRYRFLRRAGVPVALHFGMTAMTAEADAGHCWLTLDGDPLGEPRDPRPLYVEMLRIPALLPPRPAEAS